MTIEELLQELQSYWGKDWIEPALRRLLILTATPARALTDDEVQENRLLQEWALEMIGAGIAFKQSHNIEK